MELAITLILTSAALAVVLLALSCLLWIVVLPFWILHAFFGRTDAQIEENSRDIQALLNQRNRATATPDQGSN